MSNYAPQVHSLKKWLLPELQVSGFEGYPEPGKADGLIPPWPPAKIILRNTFWPGILKKNQVKTPIYVSWASPKALNSPQHPSRLLDLITIRGDRKISLPERTSFLLQCDDLVEQVGLLPGHGQLPELIEDQQPLGIHCPMHRLLEASLPMGVEENEE